MHASASLPAHSLTHSLSLSLSLSRTIPVHDTPPIAGSAAGRPLWQLFDLDREAMRLCDPDPPARYHVVSALPWERAPVRDIATLWRGVVVSGVRRMNEVNTVKL